MTTTTMGVTTNDSGKLQAALDVSLGNAGLSNSLVVGAAQAGNITSQNISIDTGNSDIFQALGNSHGTIASTGTLTLLNGALTINAGLGTTGVVSNTARRQVVGESGGTFTGTGFDDRGGQVQALSALTLIAGAGVSETPPAYGAQFTNITYVARPARRPTAAAAHQQVSFPVTQSSAHGSPSRPAFRGEG